MRTYTLAGLRAYVPSQGNRLYDDVAKAANLTPVAIRSSVSKNVVLQTGLVNSSGASEPGEQTPQDEKLSSMADDLRTMLDEAQGGAAEDETPDAIVAPVGTPDMTLAPAPATEATWWSRHKWHILIPAALVLTGGGVTLAVVLARRKPARRSGRKARKG